MVQRLSFGRADIIRSSRDGVCRHSGVGTVQRPVLNDSTTMFDVLKAMVIRNVAGSVPNGCTLAITVLLAKMRFDDYWRESLSNELYIYRRGMKMGLFLYGRRIFFHVDFTWCKVYFIETFVFPGYVMFRSTFHWISDMSYFCFACFSKGALCAYWGCDFYFWLKVRSLLLYHYRSAFLCVFGFSLCVCVSNVLFHGFMASRLTISPEGGGW